jgi:hypothetical protein
MTNLIMAGDLQIRLEKTDDEIFRCNCLVVYPAGPLLAAGADHAVSFSGYLAYSFALQDRGIYTWHCV